MSGHSPSVPASPPRANAESPAWFTVRVEDDGKLPARGDSKIIFHGVNKSGSLCLADVMLEAYTAEGRKAQFHSHYHTRGIPFAGFYARTNETPPPAFFVGHQLFGNVDLRDSAAVMITQFRHPLPRMISCHAWLRRKQIAETGSAEGFPDFATFIKEGAGKSHSQIVQFCADCGEDKRRLITKLSTRELFERSIENIERDVTFAGIAELFEESIFAVAHLCGIHRVPAWKRDERNAGRPAVSTLSPADVELLEDRYRYDFELYAWARKRFANLLAQIKIGGDIDAYRQACVSEYKDRLLTDDP